jgi:hypothetical protein
LAGLKAHIGAAASVDRAFATLLAEIVVSASGSVDPYPSTKRVEVAASVAGISESVMAVLTPDEMPPLRASA